MTKNELRAIVKEQLKLLDNTYCQTASKKIQQKLFALPQYKKAHTVFVYVSVEKEPSTRAIIEDLWHQGKRVCVPRTLGKGIMQAHLLQSWQQLHPAGYGLQEPTEQSKLVQPGEIDLLVVPCVACDEQGWRLGHGGGYYDRYLTQTKAHTVCLCYQRLLQKQLPHDELDIPMEIVLTEEQTIQSLSVK